MIYEMLKRRTSYLIRDVQEILRLLRKENKRLAEENLQLKKAYAEVKKENTRLLNQYHQGKVDSYGMHSRSL